MFLKICGLKHKENIEQVAALKPDFMGFIFYPESKRFVGEYFRMPEIFPEIKKVGVFVNAKAGYIIEKIDEYNLDLIQLHGNESASFCEVMSHIVKVIKAFGIDENFDFNILENYKGSCDYFLFDTKTEGHGGSGKQFDWKFLENYKSDVPFFLSGGIGLKEIEDVQNLKLKVAGIDVNSKFETEPGIKNIKELEKIKI
ncbi:MAG: phosphoribosylanthranilate isomerase [Bacteroidia bacterium]